MARMEFLKENQLNTTTMVTPPSGTDSVEELFDRNTDKIWESVNQTGTAQVLSVEFGKNVVLSHVLLQNMNLKTYRIFYDSSTANSLANVTQNSDTSRYHSFASVTVASIQVQMNAPITSSEEYKIGELVLTERRCQFELNPSSKNYKPRRPKTRIKHDMPDGGSRVFEIADKFSAKIRLEFISDTFTSGLESVFESGEPNYFLPFPTTSSWDGKGYEVNWLNDFDFTYAENSRSQGQSGTIEIRQTQSG